MYFGTDFFLNDYFDNDYFSAEIVPFDVTAEVAIEFGFDLDATATVENPRIAQVAIAFGFELSATGTVQNPVPVGGGGRSRRKKKKPLKEIVPPPEIRAQVEIIVPVLECRAKAIVLNPPVILPPPPPLPVVPLAPPPVLVHASVETVRDYRHQQELEDAWLLGVVFTP